MSLGSCWPALFALLVLAAPGPSWAASPLLELDVELDPGSRHIRAVAFLRPELHDFRFELHESLQVGSASANGEPLPVVAAGSQGSLRRWRVQLPARMDKLRLEYAGTLAALDRSLDHRHVLRGLAPMASAEGSFLPAGAAWYPRPGAAFRYRVTLSVPADQRALVPGTLQSEEIPAGPSGRYRASFAFSHPAEGIDLMAGPWVIRERTVPIANGGPVRLRTYFFRELDATEGLAEGYLDDVRRYLERYADEIGAYPFTEFSVVASPLPTGFGMPTLTYVGAEVLKLPFIRGTSLGHEVLHNWWGNGVRVDYTRGNWSEGLTTFMADYAFKENESEQGAREMRLGWLRDYAAVPAGAHQSLADFRTRTHGAAAAVGYGKAAMVFVMLRDTIGEDAFRRGIRAFWERHRFQAASWDDLRTAFEKAAGTSLRAFFEQWLNRAGGPEVKIADATAKAEAGKIRLTLALEQSAPAYALRLPLEIVYPDRSEMLWIGNDRRRDVETLELDTLPRGIRLDPELRLWRVLEPEQLPPILRQWLIAPAPRLALASSVRDVRAAASSLASRFFESPPREIAPEDSSRGDDPVLLIGLHADVDSALARANLPPRPSSLAGRGSAQVWTADAKSRTPLAVVSARDAEALRALLRPLPHYGAQSWLVFEGARAVDRGIWPAPGRLVPVRSR